MEKNVGWEAILDLALNEVTSLEGTSVGGSKFRAYVTKIAEQQGVSFPPDGMQSFSTFLESFPHKLIVQRTPGRDIQIVPIDRPELLTASTSPNTRARVREDFFSALTTIPNPATPSDFFYMPQTDRIERIAEGEQVDPSAVPLPATSFEREVSIRADFARAIEPGLEASTLLESLAGRKPLANFTNTVRAHGMSKQWHQFRLEHLVRDLKDWSDQRAVPWQPSWISGAPERTVAVALPSISDSSSAPMNDLFAAFVGKLSAEDMARINVPLDLVLKLLNDK